MTAWIDIFPKAQLAGDFAQSTFQSIDTGSYQTATLQVWADGLAAVGDNVEVIAQDADFNEERDFTPSDNPTAKLSADGTVLLRLALPRRFVRLEILPTGLAVSLAINVRARLLLNG